MKLVKHKLLHVLTLFTLLICLLVACTEVSELDVPLNSPTPTTDTPKTNTPEPTELEPTQPTTEPESTEPEPTVVQVPEPVAPITPIPEPVEPITEPYEPEPVEPITEPYEPEPVTPEPVTEPTQPTTPIQPPVQNPNSSETQVTLLKSYYNLHQHKEDSHHNGATEHVVYGIKYEPYQSFGRWDVLTWSSWYYRDAVLPNWLNLELNRDAKIAVLWQGDTLPSWLDASWTEGRLTDNKRTFEKGFSKGTVTLGGAEGKGSYTLLLAEADGSAPIPPSVPIGKEKPTPNTTCPTWVHDSYTTTGPDGRLYNTWHPQIDPTYWCYFGHEHGSDPSVMGGYEPYFNYVAYHNNRQDERHEGFKGFVVQDGSLTWYINIHATVGMIMRVCVPLHTVVVAATNANGELVAEIAFKGDFGETRANTGDKALLQTSACDQVALEAQNTKAEKRVRVLSNPNYEDSGYEQWRMIGSEFLGLEFNSGNITMDIRNAMTGCNGLTCGTGLLTNPQETNEIKNHGERRTINFHNGVKLTYNSAHDLNDGVADGFFYTNAYGNALAQEGEEGSIRQFIQPGLNVAGPSGFHGTQDAWQAVYEKDMHQIPSMELEDSLGRMN